jgi:hypothetical protein
VEQIATDILSEVALIGLVGEVFPFISNNSLTMYLTIQTLENSKKNMKPNEPKAKICLKLN